MASKKDTEIISPDVHADWTDGNECEHSRECFKVKEVRWIRVPMANDILTDTFNVAITAVEGLLFLPSLLTGVDTVDALTKGKTDFSHECIEIVCTCECCDSGNEQKFTAEILGEDDISFRCGFYAKQKDTRDEKKPLSMTLVYAERKVREMRDDYIKTVHIGLQSYGKKLQSAWAKTNVAKPAQLLFYYATDALQTILCNRFMNVANSITLWKIN